MKCIFQLCTADGSARSDAVSMDRAAFADRCADLLEGDALDNSLVLVLMDELKGDGLSFSRAPFLTARNFIAQFSTKEVRIHG